MVAVARQVPSDQAQPLQPYILSSNAPGSFEQRLIEVRQTLEQGGFRVLGEYALRDDVRVLAMVTTAQPGRVISPGDAMASLVRVSIARRADRVEVSYTNPEYYAAAFRSSSDGSELKKQLHRLLGSQQEFGGGNLSAAQLRRYHYSYGMEYFDDMVELRRFRTQSRAVRAVTKALQEDENLQAVFQYEPDDVPIAVLGVAVTQGEGADLQRLAQLDVGTLHQTAHLPYELILWKGRVLLPHPRFRIPVDYPSARMIGPGNLGRLAVYSDAMLKRFRDLVERATP